MKKLINPSATRKRAQPCLPLGMMSSTLLQYDRLLTQHRHTYTWLDNQKRPIKIPAHQYIQLVQKWILGKVSDPSLFPTDLNNFSGSPYTQGDSTPLAGPSGLDSSSGRDWLGKASGFPENFEKDIRGIYRQMLRCYAHIYHGHWLNPFWDVNMYRELNTCFLHYINVGQAYQLITEKEMEPMQPLVDIWVMKGLLPHTPNSTPPQMISSAST
jgi:hypothetical protein